MSTNSTAYSERQEQAAFVREQRALKGKKCRICRTLLTPENVSRHKGTGIPCINPTATLCQSCNDEFDDGRE